MAPLVKTQVVGTQSFLSSPKKIYLLLVGFRKISLEKLTHSDAWTSVSPLPYLSFPTLLLFVSPGLLSILFHSLFLFLSALSPPPPFSQCLVKPV